MQQTKHRHDFVHALTSCIYGWKITHALKSLLSAYFSRMPGDDDFDSMEIVVLMRVTRRWNSSSHKLFQISFLLSKMKILLNSFFFLA